MSLKTNGCGGCTPSMHATIELLQSIGYAYSASENLKCGRASSDDTTFTGRLAAAWE